MKTKFMYKNLLINLVNRRIRCRKCISKHLDIIEPYRQTLLEKTSSESGVQHKLTEQPLKFKILI